jgi:hypothetical protein
MVKNEVISFFTIRLKNYRCCTSKNIVIRINDTVVFPHKEFILKAKSLAKKNNFIRLPNVRTKSYSLH